MKNDEIKEANRKALPKFLLFAVVCAIVGGVIGYYSGYGAAKGGMVELGRHDERNGSVFRNAHCSVADGCDSNHRACTLPPDLSECKEIARCVGWRG